MHLRTAAQDKTAMASLLHCFWSEDDGVLSFEWTLLVTLLAIGVVGGLAGARDAVMDELGDVAEAMLALDGTYTIVSIRWNCRSPKTGARRSSWAEQATRAFLTC
jgi:Flp pilus assembly pilin Flp